MHLLPGSPCHAATPHTLRSPYIEPRTPSVSSQDSSSQVVPYSLLPPPSSHPKRPQAGRDTRGEGRPVFVTMKLLEELSHLSLATASAQLVKDQTSNFSTPLHSIAINPPSIRPFATTGPWTAPPHAIHCCRNSIHVPLSRPIVRATDMASTSGATASPRGRAPPEASWQPLTRPPRRRA